MTSRVLLIEDDAAVREALAQTLELADLDVIPAGSFVAAKDRIGPDFDGVILSDIRMPGRDGFHLLEYAHDQDPDLPVILLTGEGDIPMAVRAMRMGAFGFLEKPCAPDDLVGLLERALKARDIVLDNRRMRRLVETGDPAARMLFGTSALAEELRGRVRAVARMGEEFGTDPADLVAAVAPCIRPPLYEVDIAAAIVGQLREAGVPDEAVTDSGMCTGAAVDRYYSYRVEKGATGRMLALLGRVRGEGGRDAG